MKELLIIAFAYLLGSVPFGVILAASFGGKDITKEGSGNIGATNVARVIGKKAGAVTLLLDCLKGVFPVIVAVGVNEGQSPLVALAALAAFLGHLYPVFNSFRGGKGVATALGIFLVLNPFAALCATAIFVLFLYVWRYVSLGSMAAAFSMPALMGMFKEPPLLIAVSLLISAFVIYRHKDNIGRLTGGTEHKLGAGKKSEEIAKELEEELD